MKLCIAGDRNITDMKILLAALKESGYNNITEVVSGHAKGADILGEIWAKENGLLLRVFEPDWKNTKVEGAQVKKNAYGEYNANAGKDRSRWMVDYADAVLALQSNGPTPGTQFTLRYARDSGKPTFEYKGKKDHEYQF